MPDKTSCEGRGFPLSDVGVTASTRLGLRKGVGTLPVEDANSDGVGLGRGGSLAK